MADSAKVRKAYASEREFGFSDLLSTITTQLTLNGKNDIDSVEVGRTIDRHLEESRLRCARKAKDLAQKLADEWFMPASLVETEAKKILGTDE